MNVSRLMEDSSDSEYDVEAVANEAIANILPKKSRPQYEKAYTISGFGVTLKKLVTQQKTFYWHI
jgi:hypothetical protein